MKIFHPFWRVVSHPTDNQRNSQVGEEKWELLNDRSHFIYKAISDKVCQSCNQPLFSNIKRYSPIYLFISMIDITENILRHLDSMYDPKEMSPGTGVLISVPSYPHYSSV